MTEATPKSPQEAQVTGGTHRRGSFILRCWLGEEERIRARLIDASSGVSHPLADLSELPAVVRDLITRATKPE